MTNENEVEHFFKKENKASGKTSEKKEAADVSSNNGLYTVVVVLLFAYANIKLFGWHDTIAISFMLFTSYYLYYTIRELRMGIRNTLGVYFKEGSLLHGYFSKDYTIPQRLISIVIAVIFSAAFAIILKGLTLSHGMWGILAILVIAITAIQVISSRGSAYSIANDNANPKIDKRAIDFIAVITMAIWLNFILALTLTSRETLEFLTIEVRLDNFISSIEHKAIPWTENNTFSRVMVNFYLIVQSFKFALANEIMIAYEYDLADKKIYFYPFFFLIFILNFLKLFGLSFALVALHMSVRNRIVPALLSVTKMLDAVLDKPKKKLYSFIIARLRWIRRLVSRRANNLADKSTPNTEKDKHS